MLCEYSPKLWNNYLDLPQLLFRWLVTLCTRYIMPLFLTDWFQLISTVVFSPATSRAWLDSELEIVWAENQEPRCFKINFNCMPLRGIILELIEGVCICEHTMGLSSFCDLFQDESGLSAVVHEGVHKHIGGISRPKNIFLCHHNYSSLTSKTFLSSFVATPHFFDWFVWSQIPGSLFSCCKCSYFVHKLIAPNSKCLWN